MQITGTDDGTTLSPTSTPVTVTRGQFEPGTPTISGPAQVGGTLNANAGKWTPAGTSAYQWLRGGTPIAGATSAAYTLTPADAGQAISVEVTESDAGWADDSATSAPVTVTAAAEAPAGEPAPVVGMPTISGTVRVGATVTAEPGEWTPAATPSYQWLRDGQAIAGATSASYVVAAADAGHQLSVQVTETPAGVGTETAVSAAYEVQAGTFAPGSPSIGGNDAVGSTLTASGGQLVARARDARLPVAARRQADHGRDALHLRRDGRGRRAPAQRRRARLGAGDRNGLGDVAGGDHPAGRAGDPRPKAPPRRSRPAGSRRPAARSCRWSRSRASSARTRSAAS